MFWASELSVLVVSICIKTSFTEHYRYYWHKLAHCTILPHVKTLALILPDVCKFVMLNLGISCIEPSNGFVDNSVRL